MPAPSRGRRPTALTYLTGDVVRRHYPRPSRASRTTHPWNWPGPRTAPAAWRGVVYAGLSGEPALDRDTRIARRPHRPDRADRAPSARWHARHVRRRHDVGIHDQRWKVEGVPDSNGRAPTSDAPISISVASTGGGRVCFPGDAAPRPAGVGGPPPATPPAISRSARHAPSRSTASGDVPPSTGCGPDFGPGTVALGVTQAQEVVATGRSRRRAAARWRRAAHARRSPQRLRARELLGMAGHHLHAQLTRTMFVLGKRRTSCVRHLHSRGGLVPSIGASLAQDLCLNCLPSLRGRWPPSVGVDPQSATTTARDGVSGSPVRAPRHRIFHRRQWRQLATAMLAAMGATVTWFPSYRFQRRWIGSKSTLSNFMF